MGVLCPITYGAVCVGVRVHWCAHCNWAFCHVRSEAASGAEAVGTYSLSNTHAHARAHRLDNVHEAVSDCASTHTVNISVFCRTNAHAHRLDNVHEAVSDYTRALELEPNNATAYHNRGSLFERLGE